MMPTIRVDDEVYDLLKDTAEPFVDTPNSVLRRLVGLPVRNATDVADDQRALTRPRPDKPIQKVRRARRRPRSSEDKRARQRAPKGTLLPEVEYELPILKVLAERGGRAPAGEVIEALEQYLDGQLTKLDRERIGSGGVRWRNRAQFVRLALIKKGELASDSQRGVWELTDAGRRRAEGK
jgi:hypothetical protein